MTEKMTAFYIYLLLGFICLNVSTSERFENVKRIYGGTEVAETNTLPWKVYLKYFYEEKPFQNLTGTLISPNVVLTHAVNLVDDMSKIEIEAVLGENNTNVKESTEQIISVQSIQKYGDLALLHLSRNVTLSEAVRPIPRLASPSDDTVAMDSNYCYVVGWGRTSWKGSVNSLPRQFRVDVLSITECRNKLYRSKHSKTDIDTLITSDAICASGENGGTCSDDAGASLQCLITDTWVLVGVAAWIIKDYPCGHSFPDLYSRVSSHLSWIQQNI